MEKHFQCKEHFTIISVCSTNPDNIIQIKFETEMFKTLFPSQMKLLNIHFDGTTITPLGNAGFPS